MNGAGVKGEFRGDGADVLFVHIPPKAWTVRQKGCGISEFDGEPFHKAGLFSRGK